MVELILLVVVGTSIWVAIDARSGGDNWVAWSLGSLVMWIVVFPMYLFHRRPASMAAEEEVAMISPAAQEPPQPGWYKDPLRGGRRRWWDGRPWTDSVDD